MKPASEREIYLMYSKAQHGNGYLMIGIKGAKKNGKQVIKAFPSVNGKF